MSTVTPAGRRFLDILLPVQRDSMGNVSNLFCPFSRIIHTTLVYPLTLYQPFFGFYFFNGLMCVLQVLQIFWAVLILRMVVKFLPGNVRSATFNCPESLPSPA